MYAFCSSFGFECCISSVGLYFRILLPFAMVFNTQVVERIDIRDFLRPSCVRKVDPPLRSTESFAQFSKKTNVLSNSTLPGIKRPSLPWQKRYTSATAHAKEAYTDTPDGRTTAIAHRRPPDPLLPSLLHASRSPARNLRPHPKNSKNNESTSIHFSNNYKHRSLEGTETGEKTTIT